MTTRPLAPPTWAAACANTVVAAPATLPPGQRAIPHFPRFGVHFGRQPPDVPADPAIDVGGALGRPRSISVTRLRTLERRTLVADFHCVAGWTARELKWSGVSFRSYYQAVIVPEIGRAHV